jgi:capsular exopolysaccharide synthesis family protein
MIVGIMAVTTIAVFLSVADEKPFYEAAVQLMPSQAALHRPILPPPGASPAIGERLTDSEMPNLMSLIKSRQVAERTIRVAGLTEDPDALRDRIQVGTAPNPGARSRDEMGTDIIEIRVADDEPRRAVRIANALAHVFAGFFQEISHHEATESRKFLESQLVHSRREMETASDRLKEFKRDNRITSVTDSTSSAMSSLRQAMGDRDGARAALSETQARLAEVESQLRRTAPTRMVVEGTSDTPMAQQLESQLAQLTTQLSDTRGKYEDVHPQVVAIKSSIEQVRQRLLEERGKMRNSVSMVRDPVYEALLQERSQLASQRNGLAAKVGQLETTVGRVSGELKPGMDVALARLENEFMTAQAAYTNLKNQLGQAQISEKETTATGAIRVVDEAVRAAGPVGTNKAAYLLLGAMLSLVVGIGLALTLESLDNRIRTNLDVEHLLGLPVTGLIPRGMDSADSGLARVTHTDPLSPLSEAYRFLRTDLLLSTQATDAKAIMVATAKPGQGGTSTVANLGISLAMDGKRVMLIDADMRRPSLHRIFKVANDLGLSNVLANEKDFEEVVLATEVDNLLLIPAGPTPSNPSELLGSPRMRSLVHKLVEHSDYVLFDTPSAIAFTDAVVLSQVVDGVILVVRAQQVPRGAELQVRNLLNKANANILGVVLNDVQPDTVDSYYYHSHYYPDVGSKKEKLLQSTVERRSLPSRE